MAREKKSTYLIKLGRQLRNAEKSVRDLEKIADDRSARVNPEVNKHLNQLRVKFDDVWRKFDGLKEEKGVTWPEGSKETSTAYKELETALEAVGSEVKPK